MAICFIVLCLLLIIAKTQEQVFIVDEYGHIIEGNVIFTPCQFEVGS